MKSKFILVILAFTVLIQSCKKDADNKYGLATSSEQDLVNHALRMKGKLIEGNMPASTGANAPVITGYPSAVQVSAGVVLFIPYQISSSTNACKIYLQVDGASSYWDAQIVIDSNAGTPYLEIFIPNFVQDGNFSLKYAIADCNGNVGTYVSTNTIVTPPLQCSGTATGSVGVTVNHFNLGDKAGTVVIDYDMYTIPDRMDVRYNNQWIGSTGTNLSSAAVGPNCNIGGQVSNTGTYSFPYDPSHGRDLFVYVTGCDAGTAWSVTVNCPQ